MAVFILFSPLTARPAGAWEQVCLHLPWGKTWFVGKFYLERGFDPFFARLEGLPVKYVDKNGERQYLPHRSFLNLDGRRLPFSDRTVATELMESSDLGVGRRYCFSVRHVPEGEPLFAYVSAQAQLADVAACKTPPEDSSLWFVQTPVNQTPRKLWLRAWGSTFKVYCQYDRESD